MHRITWHADTTRSGGGAPDGSVNTDDPKVHFVYNERWQQVAAYRQANGSGVDTHPKEQFVHHNAGHGGFGGGSYIDSVILRDDHEDDWTEAADSTLERRVYYCQNWRADVVALLAENGRAVERAWYEPYGTPHGMSPADFSGTSDDTNDHYLVPDGDADADDSFVYLDLFGVSASLSDMTGSSDPGDGEYGRPNGTIDSDDYFYFLDQYSVAAALGRNVLSAGHDGAAASHGAGNLRNRRGLAGYEWDPHVRRYHVRNRVLYPEIGRWTRRDPLGYVDGAGLHLYVEAQPIHSSDAVGLQRGCNVCGVQPITGTSTVSGVTPHRPPLQPRMPLPGQPGDPYVLDYGCWSCLDYCLYNDPATRKRYREAQKQCGHDIDIACSRKGHDGRCMSDATLLGYTCCNDNSITLCSSKLPHDFPLFTSPSPAACSGTCAVIRHELTHAMQNCRDTTHGWECESCDWINDDCSACCREIEAYSSEDETAWCAATNEQKERLYSFLAETLDNCRTCKRVLGDEFSAYSRNCQWRCAGE